MNIHKVTTSHIVKPRDLIITKGDFLSFKSTTHDIIEFNPVFAVIVASHIRPRAMIIASFTSMLRISVKDCDHRSQPDVWGNNDRKHRIKPLIILHVLSRSITSFDYRIHRVRALDMQCQLMKIWLHKCHIFYIDLWVTYHIYHYDMFV